MNIKKLKEMIAGELKKQIAILKWLLEVNKE